MKKSPVVEDSGAEQLFDSHMLGGRDLPTGPQQVPAASFKIREYDPRDDEALYKLEHNSQMENPVSR